MFGKRAGEHAAKFAKEHAATEPDQAQIDDAMGAALSPFEREDGENPYAIQSDLQVLMQDNVGIVRNQHEMEQAMEGLAKLKARAVNVSVAGHREYNPGWHTAIGCMSSKMAMRPR